MPSEIRGAIPDSVAVAVTAALPWSDVLDFRQGAAILQFRSSFSISASTGRKEHKDRKVKQRKSLSMSSLHHYRKKSRISAKIFTAKNAKNAMRRTYDVSSLRPLRSLWFNSFCLRFSALGSIAAKISPAYPCLPRNPRFNSSWLRLRSSTFSVRSGSISHSAFCIPHFLLTASYRLLTGLLTGRTPRKSLIDNNPNGLTGPDPQRPLPRTPVTARRSLALPGFAIAGRWRV